MGRRHLTLESNPTMVEHFSEAHRALSLARIECHYFVNQCFMEPDQLLRDADRLRTMPGVIVHGRYDVVCPLDNAWALYQSWPEAELRIVSPAGRRQRTGHRRCADHRHSGVCRSIGMIGLLQRVAAAQVEVDGDPVGAIDAGLLVLIGVERGDTEIQADRLLERLLGYRVFADADGK